ncbi:tRNA lysidine(34) synthetase TilS [Candidatus Saccharibacteria bacterium]|nr:tRNA lysidine(34) synthetase TilS [Candidatus Saccharibacteria bacterium]
MTYILAISGGVDSVTLLDMVTKGKLSLQDQVLQREDILVAHFDHGIRDNSANDAEFVKKLATNYQVDCVIGHDRLGKNASEQLARAKRYKFLRNLCRTGSCKIMTAHHQDDLLETIIMNLIRGTGWRGLAPFWSSDIERPLLDMTKAEIVNYAIENNLDWVEDVTNYSAKYFRNRVRDFIVRMSAEQKRQLLKLNQKQTKLRIEIEKLLECCRTGSCKKSDVLSLPDNIAVECLRGMTNEKLTTLQLKRLLRNLKKAKSGDIFQPGGQIQIGLYRDQITISEM